MTRIERSQIPQVATHDESAHGAVRQNVAATDSRPSAAERADARPEPLPGGATFSEYGKSTYTGQSLSSLLGSGSSGPDFSQPEQLSIPFAGGALNAGGRDPGALRARLESSLAATSGSRARNMAQDVDAEAEVGTSVDGTAKVFDETGKASLETLKKYWQVDDGNKDTNYDQERCAANSVVAALVLQGPDAVIAAIDNLLAGAEFLSDDDRAWLEDLKLRVADGSATKEDLDRLADRMFYEKDENPDDPGLSADEVERLAADMGLTSAGAEARMYYGTQPGQLAERIAADLGENGAALVAVNNGGNALQTNHEVLVWTEGEELFVYDPWLRPECVVSGDAASAYLDEHAAGWDGQTKHVDVLVLDGAAAD
ncbi:MAG: hypothetical protein HYV63_10180 [Candidatus Schekmanbacteria bacterium]|nr:hypothetical protein [Candidatus Schekmanbacteria bacterium]